MSHTVESYLEDKSLRLGKSICSFRPLFRIILFLKHLKQEPLNKSMFRVFDPCKFSNSKRVLQIFYC